AMNNLGRSGRAAGQGSDWPNRQQRDQSPVGASAGQSMSSTSGMSRTYANGRDTGTNLIGHATSAVEGATRGIEHVRRLGEAASADQEPDEDMVLGETLATLPPPDEGCVYRLEPMPDGSVAVVHCEDNGADMNMNAEMMTHKLTGDAAFMKRLN